MISALPLTLISLVLAVVALRSRQGADCSALASPSSRAGLVWLLLLANTALAARVERVEKRSTPTQTFPNGTNYVWTVQDTYEGSTFFDTFEFYTGEDPTHYTDRNTAFADGLAYVESDGIVVMKGDNTTTLSNGQYRNSVRISSQKQYNTGLFILDLDMAPWGCGVWPAWWTVGGGTWPWTGEIDIIEGVHDNQHNQVTWHTGPNCNMTQNANFTGTIVPNLVCNCVDNFNSNAGCGVTEWSRASYGPIFDEQSGGVFAMKWDVSGIGVWSFYRAAVPQDVTNGQPTPSTWGEPVAFLEAGACDPLTNFINHSIIFDITFCGDWAGNDYTTSGCPGTCAERLMEPSNFDNASWRIRSLTVYRQQVIHGQVASDAARPMFPVVPMLGVMGVLFGVLL
ncbi:concanavalin A-like lectin/glucanase domain-containing protein [Fomitopsis serialis]|uniref:concanavalin A-like lectin/glucanase domain-containing protein n=1 Tax=Fomitopsis serialis TaxID=139415 RepID=UPI002007DF71|nr:concanavalin A-like lectin/glucanase domain-containing protein [Neoantrodia serialis]KAH9937666.1 concanavalin A-like lectin/glucanase domain-containing protein [Neoantrodia serialis]